MDPYLKIDLSNTICLIKYNGPALRECICSQHLLSYASSALNVSMGISCGQETRGEKGYCMWHSQPALRIMFFLSGKSQLWSSVFIRKGYLKGNL